MEDEGSDGLYSGLVGGEGKVGLVGDVGLKGEFADLKGGMCNIIGTDGAVAVGLGATGGGTFGSGDVESGLVGSAGTEVLVVGIMDTVFTGGTTAFCCSVGDFVCCTVGRVLAAGSPAGFTC